MRVSLRPATSDDDAFLFSLLFESVAANPDFAHFPTPLRQQLLELQVSARRTAVNNLPGSRDEIILCNGERAGWLNYAETGDELRLVEILIAPARRNAGIGSHLIRLLIDRSAAARNPLRLAVDSGNHDALRLYQRLGFRIVESDQFRHTMEFRH